MKRIYLLRHGQSELDGKYVGRTNCGLSSDGVKQIEDKRDGLSTIVFDRVFVSPMARCIETLDILRLTSPIETLDNLKEIDFGDWEGKTFLEIYNGYRPLFDTWRSNPLSFQFPSGESIQSFIARIHDVHEFLVSNQDDESSILLVTHGGVIRMLLCLLLGLELDQNEKFSPETGSFAMVEIYPPDSVTLKAFNK